MPRRNTITVEEIPEILERMIKHPKLRKSVVFIGSPGIGKTTGVEEFIHRFAEKNNLRIIRDYEITVPKPCDDCLVYIKVVVSSAQPEDLGGLPDKFRVKLSDGREYVVAYRMPMNIWIQCKLAKYCVVVIDEFNTTESRDMEALVMNILGHCNPTGSLNICEKKDGWTLIVAMGNPPEMSGVAGEPPAPMLGGKIRVYYVEPPRLEAWIKYMYEKHGDRWDTRVAGFLAKNPSFFSQTPRDPRTLKAYPTPRGWEAVAVYCGHYPCDPDKIDDVTYTSIAGEVGVESIEAYLEWLKLTPPRIEDVLASSDRVELYVKAVMYASWGGLCHDVDSKPDAVKQLINTLTGEELGAVTYLTAPHCPEKMTRLYELIDSEDKKRVLMSIRFKMAKTVKYNVENIMAELV